MTTQLQCEKGSTHKPDIQLNDHAGVLKRNKDTISREPLWKINTIL